MTFPPLPSSWSALSWQQLCHVWRVKMQYGGNADVARVAAMLDLLALKPVPNDKTVDNRTGETVYSLRDNHGQVYTTTPRALAQMARAALPWMDYPYGDPGEREMKDADGNVIKPARMGVDGYVSPMRDALILPEEHVTAYGRRFALPQVACNNLTWQQYRALQAITTQLFAEGTDEQTVIHAQAQFLAHILVPRSMALLDTAGGSIRLRPHHEYRYNADQAASMTKFWARKLRRAANGTTIRGRIEIKTTDAILLFHICFQTYQTALSYYSQAYPLLFGDNGKKDAMTDALQGEVGTVNTIMKYAGYAEQQQVYDSNLPFILDILNTMAREAQEVEKAHSKARKK